MMVYLLSTAAVLATHSVTKDDSKMSSLKVCYRKNGEHCAAIKNNMMSPKERKRTRRYFHLNILLGVEAGIFQ